MDGLKGKPLGLGRQITETTDELEDCLFRLRRQTTLPPDWKTDHFETWLDGACWRVPPYQIQCLVQQTSWSEYKKSSMLQAMHHSLKHLSFQSNVRWTVCSTVREVAQENEWTTNQILLHFKECLERPAWKYGWGDLTEGILKVLQSRYGKLLQQANERLLGLRRVGSVGDLYLSFKVWDALAIDSFEEWEIHLFSDTLMTASTALAI